MISFETQLKRKSNCLNQRSKSKKGRHVKVSFFQKVLTHLSFPQTYEPFIFLSLKIWILVTEIGDVLKFDFSEACKFKKVSIGWLPQPYKKVSKIQNFKFSSSCVWRNDKCSSTFWKKDTFSYWKSKLVEKWPRKDHRSFMDMVTWYVVWDTTCISSAL